MTVYEAVKQYSRTHDHEGTDTDTDSEMLFGNASIWINTHTIWLMSRLAFYFAIKNEQLVVSNTSTPSKILLNVKFKD